MSEICHFHNYCKNFVIILVSSSLIIAKISLAQSSADFVSSAFYPKYSKLRFSQDLNIYEWLYSFRFQKLLNDRLWFNIEEGFHTTLQSISTNDRWKDDQNLKLTFSYPFSKRVSIGTEMMSHVLSDPLAGFDNDVTFHGGTAKLVYQPTAQIYIAPELSSKWQTQLDKSDQGYSYGLNANINNVDLYGYENDLLFQGEQDFFPQRKNEDFKIRYQIERQFYQSTADTVTIFFDRLRRDSFGQTGLNPDSSLVFIRNLVQSNRGFENRLSYELAGSSTVLFLTNSIRSTSFKVINFQPDTEDLRKDDSGFESQHSATLSTAGPSWFGNLGWNYRFRTRDDNRPSEATPDPFGRHPSVGFDTKDVLVGLNMRSGLRLDHSDSVGVFASVSKFRYETTDTLNPNDHDQIRWQFTFSHAHKFDPSLRLVWRGSVFLNHFVFISSKFSSGNNWERIFQLMPTVVFQPNSDLYFEQRFIVRAKYQTYDFDDPETSNRNIVNRQFIVSNSSNFALTSRTWMQVALNFELAEQGKLFYDLWRQRLALSWRNHEIKVLFRHRVGRNLTVAPGGKLFQQTRWEHRLNAEGNFQRRVQDKHTNWGPIVQIAYRPSPKLEFIFLGNIQMVNSSRQNSEQINNFDVNLNWFF